MAQAAHVSDQVQGLKPEVAQWKVILRRLLRNRSAMVGGAVFLFMILVAVFADVLSPYPRDENDLKVVLNAPSWSHWFGTDNVGRDVLTRTMHGSRISLTVGVVVQSISLTIGTSLGLISGFYGGWVDDFLNGVCTVLQAFPGLLWALAIMAVLGPGIYNIFWALGVISWPTVFRLVRGEVLALKEREFIEAARALGLPTARIVFRHLLPNAAGPIIVVGTLGMAGAVVTEATLSFLGLGVVPPTPSWGSQLAFGRDVIFQAPWMTIFPGLAIFVTILGLNLFGDGLRDVLDPRLKQ